MLIVYSGCPALSASEVSLGVATDDASPAKACCSKRRRRCDAAILALLLLASLATKALNGGAMGWLQKCTFRHVCTDAGMMRNTCTFSSLWGNRKSTPELLLSPPELPFILFVVQLATATVYCKYSDNNVCGSCLKPGVGEVAVMSSQSLMR